MFVVSSERGTYFRATVAGWLLAIGRTIRERYSHWAERRCERAVARALYYASDIELRDMGINRGDIHAVASGTYRRD
jgi:uncharacterized protein YjiS (DUF1127 family)